MELFIPDCLSRHKHGKIEMGMKIAINAIESCEDMVDYMTEEDIRSVTIDDKYVSILSDNVFHGWPSMIAEVQIYSCIGHSEMN